MYWTALLLLLSLSQSLIISNAQKQATCSPRCSGIQTKFKYVKGTSYSYKYESDTKIQLVGTSKTAASVSFTATATFSVVDTCEWVLKLSQVQLKGPSAAQIGEDWAKDLEKSALPFAYDNGEIRGLCPSDESTSVLNIKRGILSTLQLANDFDTEDGYETDVVGHCPTKYQNEGGKSVTKTKNLISCQGHVSNYTSVRSVPYDIRSNFQNIPLMAAKQVCKYSVAKDIISEAACTETHGFLPYRNIEKDGGITANVASKLTFTSESKGAQPAGAIGQLKPLLFDDKELIWKESKEGLAHAKAVLKTLCDTSKDDVRPETPAHFTELVYELKTTPVADLKTLAQEAKGKPPCPKFRKFFIDAVAQCGTTACVTVLVELLTTKDSLSPVEEKMALGNLALAAHPTKGMITAVTGSLENLPKNGLYAATSLVHNFCRLHSECEKSAEVKAFVQKLIGIVTKFTILKKIAGGDKTIEGLRAFGNLGYVPDGIKERLKFLDAGAHLDQRLAAIQSVRRAPCTDDLESKLFATFVDEKENVEIRISAFSVLMQQCATKEFISKVVNATNDIQINQIGSFVQTYFDQVRSSSDPSKDRNVFAKAYLSKKFQSDPRKHSRYYEFSHFNYDWNMGVHGDYALIYSPDDFFPKQKIFNFTVDAFGSEINLFEIGLRTENMDEVFDNLFGPEGYFTNPTGFYEKEDAKKKLSIKDPKISEFQNAFEKLKKVPSKGLDYAMYFRVFGNELSYCSDYDIPVIDRFQKFVQPGAILNVLSKEKSLNLAAHRLPFDNYFTIPVVSGLPIRLDINGTITANLDLSVKADLLNLHKGNVDLKLSLNPSAAYESAVQLAIHTGKAKHGVRYVKRGHTSTAAGIEFNVANKDTLKAKLSVPKNKLELANFESHVYTLVNDVPVEEKGETANRGEGSACTPQKWSDKTGFKVCSSLSYPNSSQVPNAPFYPLTGPSDFKLYLEKVDPKLSAYELSASWKSTPAGRDIKFSFNTPGSQTNREVSLNVNYVRQKSVNLELKTPVRSIKAEGTLDAASADKTAATVKATVDSKVYEIKGNLQSSPIADNGKKYVFDGQIKGADSPKAGTVKYTLERIPTKKLSIDLNVDNLFDKPIVWKGKVEKQGPGFKYVIDHDVKAPWIEEKITGNVNFQSVANVDYSFDYNVQRPGDPKPKQIAYSHKHSFQKADKAFKGTANAKVTSTTVQLFNFGYDLTLEKTPDKLDIKVATMIGGQPALTFNQLTTIKPKDYTTTATLTYPKANVNEKLQVIYKNQLPKDFEVNVKLEDLAAKKEIQALARMKRDSPADYIGEYEAVLRVPGRELKFLKVVKGAGPGQYDCTTNIQWAPDKKAEIKATMKGNRDDFELKSNIQLPNSDPLEFSKTFKRAAGAVKYTGVLKKAGQVLIDLNLDTKLDGQKKTVKARAQSAVQKFDVGVDGSVETLPVARKALFTISRDNKEYLKGEVVVPNTFKHDADKQAKVDIIWDLPTAKQLAFELATKKSGANAVDHDASFKINTPEADYKFELKRRHNDLRATNFTIYKKNAPIVQLSAGRSKQAAGPGGAISGSYDLSLKTLAPMTPRDLSGDVSFSKAANGVKVNVNLQSKQDNQKLAFDLDVKKTGDGKAEWGYDKSVGLVFNEYSVKFKNLVSNQGGKGATLKGEAVLSEKGKDQKFGWNTIYTAEPSRKIDASFDTPFPNAPKITLKSEYSKEGNKRKRNFELTWGKNKISGQGTRESDENKFYNHDLTLETSFDALKALSYSTKYDTRKGQEAEFKGELNKLHKVGANYKRSTESGGDEKWGMGVQAKLGAAVDYESTASATWNPASGKYVTNNLIKTDANTQYKADVDFNAKTMEAKVNLVNVPGITGPVKAQAKKIAEDEYELALSDAGGANKGTIGFKLTAPSQKLRLETPAFKGSYESEWSPTKWLVAGDVVPDPKAADKSYSVKLTIDTPDAKSRKTEVLFGYPERKMSFSSKRVKNLPQKLEQNIEINPNVGKRQPTKVDLSYVPNIVPNPGSAELHLADPALPQGVHLLSKFAFTGDWKKEGSPFSFNYDVTLKYSADAKKHLNLKRDMKLEFVDKRQKVSNSHEITHEATNLKHKAWNTYLLEPCSEGTPVCEYIFVYGIQYLDNQKQLQEYSVDFKRSHKDFDAQVSVNKDKYKVTRKYGKGQSIYTVSKNNQELYDVIGECIREGEQTLGLSIVKKPENNVLFRAAASLPSNDLASFKVYHDENGQIVKDVEATIKLEASDRLKLRLYKRPGLIEALTNIANKYIPTKAPTTADVANAVTETLTPRAIGADIAKELKPLLDSWDKEDDAIAKELKFTSGKLASALSDTYKDINKQLEQVAETFIKFGTNFANTFQNIARSWIDGVKNIYSKLPDVVSKVGPQFAEIRQRVKNRVKVIYDNVVAILNQIYTTSRLKEVVEFIIKSYNAAPQANLAGRVRQLFKDIQKLFPETKGPGALAEFQEKWRAIKEARVKQWQDAWEQTKKDLSQNEDWKEVVKFLDLVFAKLTWAYNYAKPEKQATGLIEKIKATYETSQPTGFVYNKSADGLTYYAEIPLYYRYNSLPDLAQSFTPDRLQGKIQDLKFSTEDYLDSMYGSDESTDWFSKGDSTALVIGEQYFVTFNGELRQIGADCSYLLARDFKDSKFSISADFEKSARKNLVVQYGENKIEILYDGKVQINGKAGEFPWHELDAGGKWKIKVYKHDDNVVVLETFDGLKINYNTFNHIGEITLKGRFRGKTGGLLGRNDGEPYLDLSQPDGKLAPHLAAFLSTWAIKPQCASSPNRPDAQALPLDHKLAHECSNLFVGRRAQLGRCSKVNDTLFRDMCLQHLFKHTQKEKDEAKQTAGVCQSAAAYLAICNQNADLPSQCIKCLAPSADMNLHDSLQFSGKNLLKAVDVVFAFEERNCLKDAKGKLAQLAQKVDGSLKQAGYEPKFGLVGFNGEGVHYWPNHHTGQGFVNFDASSVQSVVGQLALAEEDPKVLQNPLTVIDFIIDHYPFRPASRKLLVLFACRNCEGFELEYFNLQNKLLGQSFSLHLVTTQKIELGSESKEALVAFDASAMVKVDGKENAEIRKDLVEPHDSCTVLAQETNGTVFSLFEKNGVNTVFDTLAQRLAKTADGNTCNFCECRVHDMHPKTVCFPCDIPKPVILTSDKSGFFSNPFQKLKKLQQKPTRV